MVKFEDDLTLILLHLPLLKMFGIHLKYGINQKQVTIIGRSLRLWSQNDLSLCLVFRTKNVFIDLRMKCFDMNNSL